MDSKSVCFVVPGSYPGQGATASFEYSHAIARLGWSVIVVALQTSKRHRRDSSENSVRKHLLPYEGLAYDRNKIPYVLEVSRKLRSLETQHDIVHIYHFRGVGLLPILLGRSYAKWVLDIRSPILATGIGAWRRRLSTRIEAYFFDRICVASGEVGKDILGDRAEFTVLPPGVNIQRFREAAGSRSKHVSKSGSNEDIVRLCYLGVMDHRRRLTNLLDAFARATLRNPRIELWMVGVGPDLEDLKAVSLELGAQAKVHFTGYVPYREIPSVLSAVDVGISYIPMVSYYDEAPALKTLEYLAAGLPVIATGTRANRELIDHEGTGLIVGDSPEELSTAILMLASDEDLRRRLAQSAPASVRDYDWQIHTEKILLPTYRDLLSSTTNSGS